MGLGEEVVAGIGVGLPSGHWMKSTVALADDPRTEL